MNRSLRIAAGLGLGALFLWLTLRGVDGAALAAALATADPGALALAPACLALGYAARVLRWRRMLAEGGRTPPLARTGAAFLASIAVNNLVPLRAGDVLRCVAFPAWLGVPAGRVLASVLVERLLDLVALILALGLALWLLVPGLAGPSAPLLLLAGLACAVLLLRPALMAPVLAALARLAGRLAPPLAPRIAGFTASLSQALDGLGSRASLPALLGWSLPVWVFEGATYWAVARALPGLTAPWGAWAAMPAGTLATLVPSTPGHLGPFDFAAQAAMLAAGNPLAQATAFVLIIHAVLWLTTTTTGSLCLLVWSLRRPA